MSVFRHVRRVAQDAVAKSDMTLSKDFVYSLAEQAYFRALGIHNTFCRLGFIAGHAPASSEAFNIARNNAPDLVSYLEKVVRTALEKEIDKIHQKTVDEKRGHLHRNFLPAFQRRIAAAYENIYVEWSTQQARARGKADAQVIFDMVTKIIESKDNE